MQWINPEYADIVAALRAEPPDGGPVIRRGFLTPAADESSDDE